MKAENKIKLKHSKETPQIKLKRDSNKQITSKKEAVVADRTSTEVVHNATNKKLNKIDNNMNIKKVAGLFKIETLI